MGHNALLSPVRRGLCGVGLGWPHDGPLRHRHGHGADGRPPDPRGAPRPLPASARPCGLVPRPLLRGPGRPRRGLRGGRLLVRGGRPGPPAAPVRLHRPADRPRLPTGAEAAQGGRGRRRLHRRHPDRGPAHGRARPRPVAGLGGRVRVRDGGPVPGLRRHVHDADVPAVRPRGPPAHRHGRAVRPQPGRGRGRRPGPARHVPLAPGRAPSRGASAGWALRLDRHGAARPLPGPAGGRLPHRLDGARGQPRHAHHAGGAAQGAARHA